MTQLEFYKSFQFVFELIIAELLYVYKLPRKPHFALRLTGAVAALFLFAFLIPVPVNNAYYFAFIFLVIFIVSFLLQKLLFRSSWLTIFFCCIAGYTTQHMAYETYTLFTNIMGVNMETPLNIYSTDAFTGVFPNAFIAAVYFVVYVLVYCICFFSFSERMEAGEEVHLKTSFIFLFVILILIIDIVLNAVIVYYVSPDGNVLYLVIAGVYNILCCIIGLYLQFAVALQNQLELTLDRVQQLWHQAKEQYSVSKENIELINIKCHDLKHQLRALGGAVSPAVLRELEERVSIYDSTVKTGNAALDIILTEKSLLCSKNGIKFSCIVDGARLSFMAEEDIYALFGNIIDNAIEAVVKVKPEQRVVSLQVKCVNDLLVIKETNYFGDEIVFENGLPRTTKEDTRFHGYGIKSIQYICQQYGGDVTIKAEDNVFTLSILFLPSGQGE